jgi:hypothetical protein
VHLDERQVLSFHVAGEIPDLQGLFLRTMDHNLGCATPATVALIEHDNLKSLFAAFPRVGEILWRETLIDAAVSASGSLAQVAVTRLSGLRISSASCSRECARLL